MVPGDWPAACVTSVGPIFCRNRDTSSRVEWKELWVSGAAPAPALPRATGGASAAAAQPGHAGKTSWPTVRHPDREEALTEPRPLCGSSLPTAVFSGNQSGRSQGPPTALRPVLAGACRGTAARCSTPRGARPSSAPVPTASVTGVGARHSCPPRDPACSRQRVVSTFKKVTAQGKHILG